MTNEVYEVTHRGYLLNEDRRMIFKWAIDIGLSMKVTADPVDLITFEPMLTWHFKTEEDKLLFLLKWSNTR